MIELTDCYENRQDAQTDQSGLIKEVTGKAEMAAETRGAYSAR